jgi:hypothetical protein
MNLDESEWSPVQFPRTEQANRRWTARCWRIVAYPDRTAFFGDYFRIGGHSTGSRYRRPSVFSERIDGDLATNESRLFTLVRNTSLFGETKNSRTYLPSRLTSPQTLAACSTRKDRFNTAQGDCSDTPQFCPCCPVGSLNAKAGHDR